MENIAYDYLDDEFDNEIDEVANEVKLEADAQSEETEYANALVDFNDAAHAHDATLASVDDAFDDLMSAALDNPFGQDVMREAAEVLEDTGWQIKNEDSILEIERREPKFFTVDGGDVTEVEETDVSELNIDWVNNVLCFARNKSEALDLAGLSDAREIDSVPMLMEEGGVVWALVPHAIKRFYGI